VREILIVFDVDGTLVGDDLTDWASFDAAFEEAAGFALEQTFWDNLEEVTAQVLTSDGHDSEAERSTGCATYRNYLTPAVFMEK
jgi:hypothetical protein